MHLKKCTLFLSFCTVFTPKRPGSPPFERKRCDGEKGILLSHLCGFSAARGRTSSSVILHRQPRTHFSFAMGLFVIGQGACFFELSHRQSRTHFSFATRLFTIGQGSLFFSRFHIDSHARIFLLRWDYSRSGEGGVVFFELSHRQSQTRFSFAMGLFAIGQGKSTSERNTVQGRTPAFFGAEVSSAGEKKDAAFFRRSERKRFRFLP